jgi:nicotinamidase-related amidase
MPTLDPTTTALLVMDFQNGIVGMLPDPQPLLARTKRAVAIARAHGAHVGHVRVAFTEAEMDALPARNKISGFLAAGREHFLADAPATAIHPELAPQPGDIVVRKSRVGPFTTTDLHEQLQARGVTSLLLAGIATSGVVLSVVREAADRDYGLSVIADACADREEEVHRFVIERIFPRMADVTSVDDLETLLG